MRLAQLHWPGQIARNGAAVHIRKNTLIVGAILFGFIVLVSEILWPAYRGFRRHSFASQAILAAWALKPVIAERLLKREGGVPINAGLRIETQPPISGGYVASDGTVVVEAELDFLVPFTLILRPRMDSRNAVEWTCGVATESQTRYVSQQCRRVLDLPDKR